MPRLGFIRSKNEIKLLILYIADRLIEPVSFLVMQELTMCDPAIDFFDFSECFHYLVRTEHLALFDDERYAITDKGRQNGRACASEIPYTVRLEAEKLVEAQNQKILRARQVQSEIAQRDNGIFSVTLRFNDDSGVPLWCLELAVPSQAKAELLSKRFETNPEQMYGQLIGFLFPPESEDTGEADEADKHLDA